MNGLPSLERIAPFSGRPWVWRRADPARVFSLAQAHGLPELVARVLVAREVGAEEVDRFLAPRLWDWLPDPALLPDFEAAAERLVEAIRNREPVGILGDYDVDGACSAALLAEYLEELGCPVAIRIPDRHRHGYGPHPELLSSLAEAGIRLILTVDCGTTARGTLDAARAQGLDIIVLDHHGADAELPDVRAVVNPNRRETDEARAAFGDCCAAGVVFAFLAGMNRVLRECDALAGDGRTAPRLLEKLDLVALATVADVMPLRGLNRAFVAQGLRLMSMHMRPGLRALAEVAGLASVSECGQLGFALGPRLNAGGRLGDSGLAVRLLRSRSSAEAKDLAARLNELNRSRQQLERRIERTAEGMLEAQLRENRPLLLAAGTDWHPGILGIVAGRLMERHSRPVLVLARENGILRGSGRSVRGFDLGAAVLEAVAEGLLVSGGGHPMAAGVSLEPAQLERFRAFLEGRAAASFGGGPPPPIPLELDGMLSAGAVTPGIARDLQRLAPFGIGNPAPRFCLTDATPVTSRIVGERHVDCRIAAADGSRVRAIAFRSVGTPLGERLLAGRTRLWLAGRIRLEKWQGREQVSFQIEDAAEPPGA